MEKTFFKIEGRVRENIVRKQSDDWILTNFLVTSIAGIGKDKKPIYNNFPIICWYDADIQEGDEVVIIGELRMQNAGKGKYLVQLVANKGGISYKLKTKLAKTGEKPKELNKAEEIFAEDLNREIGYTDSDIPF